MVMPYHLHMPSYFLETFTEYPGLNLNAQIVCLSPSQWLNCFLEMLEVVPEKFHPS